MSYIFFYIISQIYNKKNRKDVINGSYGELKSVKF